MGDDDLTAEQIQRHVELGDERADTPMQAQQDAAHGNCVVALVVGALAGAATGVGVGMVIGAWVL